MKVNIKKLKYDKIFLIIFIIIIIFLSLFYLILNNPKVYTFLPKDKSSNKTIFILGSVHGNEPAGTKACNKLIEYLNKNVPNNKIIIMPMPNLLGYYTNNRYQLKPFNSDINRKWYYLIIEFIENFINSGGILIFFLYFSNFKLFFIDKIYSFNYNSIILWALFYATYHLINYEFKNEGHSHNIHHKFVNLNYGYDFMDIIYGTKYDMNNLDNMNDGSLNLIIITLLLIIPKIYNYYKNI